MIIIIDHNKIMIDFDDNYVMMMIMTMNRHDRRHPRSFNSILNFYRWVGQTCLLHIIVYLII